MEQTTRTCVVVVIGTLHLLARNMAAVRRVHVRLARARRRRVVVVLRFDLRLSDVLTTANRKTFTATIHRITTQHNNYFSSARAGECARLRWLCGATEAGACVGADLGRAT